MPRRRLTDCSHRTFVLAAVASLAVAPLTPRTSEAAIAMPGGCIVLAEGFLPDTGWRSEHPAQPSPDTKRPLSEADVKALIEGLEPVPLKGGEGVAVRAVVDGKFALPPDRLGVVVGDVMTLMAMLDARDALAGLGKVKAAPEQRRALEQNLGRLIDCGESRFAGRGDAAALKTSLELVRKHRRELEPVLLDRLQPRKMGKDGPR